MSAQHIELDNVRRDYEIREKRGPNKENKSDTSAGDGWRSENKDFNIFTRLQRKQRFVCTVADNTGHGEATLKPRKTNHHL